MIFPSHDIRWLDLGGIILSEEGDEAQLLALL
jgi:hypothetical protein